MTNLLLVDDEPALRTLVAERLATRGFEVVTCESGEKAIELLDSFAFDIIVTDMRMPGVDGMQVVDAARERYPGIVTIVITGFGTVDGKIDQYRGRPYTAGNEVPYATSVASLGAARAFGAHLTAGLAARLRTGRLDFDSRRSVALDAGVVADHLTPVDARVAIATFLASPWSTTAERASVSFAADARVSPAAARYRVRAGIASQVTQRGPTDTFANAALWIGGWDVHAGVALTDAYGARNTRSRLGLGFTYGKYHVGLAREASPADLGSSYQFALTTTWP